MIPNEATAGRVEEGDGIAKGSREAAASAPWSVPLYWTRRSPWKCVPEAEKSCVSPDGACSFPSAHRKPVRATPVS